MTPSASDDLPTSLSSETQKAWTRMGSRNVVKVSGRERLAQRGGPCKPAQGPSSLAAPDITLKSKLPQHVSGETCPVCPLFNCDKWEHS